MNSFNHYAYGAVGAWMVEAIAGIRPDPVHPGFKHFSLQPRFPPAFLEGRETGITWVRAAYHSPYGLIKSHWRAENGVLVWEVTVPPNSTATAYFPAGSEKQVYEGDTPLTDAQGVGYIKKDHHALITTLQSGTYIFRIH